MPKQSDNDRQAAGKPFRECLMQVALHDQLLLVGDADKGEKAQAIDRIVAMGLEAVYPAIESAIRDDDHADLRNGAMEILVGFGTEALPRLFGLLRDDNEEVRNFAAVMLGSVGSSAAVGPLVRALDDPDTNVRHAAAEALGKIKDDAAIDPLLKLLNEGFWHQYAAIHALGEIGAPGALPHLIELLHDDALVEPVVEALEKIGDPRALAPLMELADRLAERPAALVRRAVDVIRRKAAE
jgi:HEAT repeat protein